MPLKTYKQANQKKAAKGIPSGVQSHDSDAELLIVKPLQEHPEIKGNYRAVDPNTGWMGWVPYDPPASAPISPEEESSAKHDIRKYYDLKEMVDAGLYTEDEVGLPELKGSIRSNLDLSSL